MGDAAHHPVAFNTRMHRTKTVAEKKVCSSRQRSLNKTILQAGLLVAACHNIYTPEHLHNANGGSFGRTIEHIKEQLSPPRERACLSSQTKYQLETF